MKTVIITGASRGIGFVTANVFLEHGWSVIGTYNTHLATIEHQNFHPLSLNLADQQSIQKAVTFIKELNQPVDVLINNAGINLEKLAVTEIDTIRKVFEVNLFGLINFTEELLPFLAINAHIINISSRKSLMSTPIDNDVLSGYRMTKVALNMYTRELASRLGSKGIVSSFDPGWVKTDMGYTIATETQQPQKEPFIVAEELYNLATNVTVESGLFWSEDKIQNW